MKTVLTKTLALVTGSFLLAACGASPGSENDGTGSANEALTIHPIPLPYNCTTMAPNANVSLATSGAWDDADIAAPYGSIFCLENYVVQVTGAYAPEENGGFTAQVAPAQTTSEAECASTTTSLTLYGANSGGAWVNLGSESVAGRWVKGTPGTLIETGCYFGTGAPNPNVLMVGTGSFYSTYRAVGSVFRNQQQVAMSMGVWEAFPPK